MTKYFIVFASALAFLGCSDTAEYPENPRWLNDKIASIADDAFPGTELRAYRWNSNYVYHFVNPVSSCAFCEVYTYEGKLVSFGPEKFDDFMKNAKLQQVVWKKE